MIAIAPAATFSLQVGVSFTRTFIASGGQAPYSLNATGVPKGLTFVNGILSGIPGKSGGFVLTIYAVDANGFGGSIGIASNIQAAADTIPDAFTFTDAVNVALGSAQVSNAITVSGIDSPAPVTVSGGVYYKNGGLAQATATTALAGDTFAVGHSASGSNLGVVSTTLTIGGVSATFTSTTLAAVGAVTFPATTDSTILPPSLALTSAQSAYPVTFSVGNLGDAATGDTIWLERRNSSLGVVDRFYHTLTDTDFTGISGAAVSLSFAGLSAVTTGTWRWYAYRQRGTSVSTAGNLVVSGPNDVAPQLSLPTIANLADTQAAVGATTDYPDGTAKFVITASSTAPTPAQVAAGQNNAGAAAIASGSVTITGAGAFVFPTATGLTASTTYYAYMIHTPAVGPVSAVLSETVTTTAAIATSGFDPALAEEAYTLSNSNRTVAKLQNTNAQYGSVGATTHSTGLYAVEYIPDSTNVPSADTQFGFKDTGSGTIWRIDSAGNSYGSDSVGTSFGYSMSAGDKVMLIVNLSSSAISGYPARSVSYRKNGSATGAVNNLPSGLVNARLWAATATPIGGKFTANTGQLTPMGGVPSGVTMWG